MVLLLTLWSLFKQQPYSPPHSTGGPAGRTWPGQCLYPLLLQISDIVAHILLQRADPVHQPLSHCPLKTSSAMTDTVKNHQYTIVKCISRRHPQQQLTLWKTINTLCKAYHLKTSPAMTDTGKPSIHYVKHISQRHHQQQSFTCSSVAARADLYVSCHKMGIALTPEDKGDFLTKEKQSNIVTRWLFDVYFSHKLIFS